VSACAQNIRYGMPDARVRVSQLERLYIPEEAGRGQVAGVPVLRRFRAGFGHAGRRAGVKVERPTGRMTLRPVLFPAHTGSSRETPWGHVDCAPRSAEDAVMPQRERAQPGPMLPGVGNLAAMASAWPPSFLAPRRPATRRVARRPAGIGPPGPGGPPSGGPGGARRRRATGPRPARRAGRGSAVRRRRGPGENGGALIDRRVLDELPGCRGPRRPVPYR